WSSDVCSSDLGQLLRNRERLALQRQCAGIHGQAIECGPIPARKGFQPIKMTGPLECGGVELHCMQGGITARTTAGVFLEPAGMRCTVRAQEEAIGVASRGIQ